MRFRSLFFAVFSLFTVALAGCGGGGDGLNGAVTVTAVATGAVIKATAQYTHPTETNLIGQPIKLSYRVGNGPETDLDTFYTNNSGIVTVTFQPAAFTGSQVVTVFAQADKLTDSYSISISGLGVALTPPPAITNQQTQVRQGDPVSFTVPALQNFISVTDPFTGGTPRKFKISYTLSSPSGADLTDVTVRFGTSATTTVETDAFGKARFPGAQVSVPAPAIGSSVSFDIIWTVTEEFTNTNGQVVDLPGGLVATATTTVVVNNASGTP